MRNKNKIKIEVELEKEKEYFAIKKKRMPIQTDVKGLQKIIFGLICRARDPKEIKFLLDDYRKLVVAEFIGLNSIPLVEEVDKDGKTVDT